MGYMVAYVIAKIKLYTFNKQEIVNKINVKVESTVICLFKMVLHKKCIFPVHKIR